MALHFTQAPLAVQMEGDLGSLRTTVDSLAASLKQAQESQVRGALRSLAPAQHALRGVT